MNPKVHSFLKRVGAKRFPDSENVKTIEIPLFKNSLPHLEVALDLA